jgi:hypothetical protein
LGVLYTTEGKRPEKRLATALSAAQAFSARVRSPFHIEKLWCEALAY